MRTQHKLWTTTVCPWIHYTFPWRSLLRTKWKAPLRSHPTTTRSSLRFICEKMTDQEPKGKPRLWNFWNSEPKKGFSKCTWHSTYMYKTSLKACPFQFCLVLWISCFQFLNGVTVSMTWTPNKLYKVTIIYRCGNHTESYWIITSTLVMIAEIFNNRC